MGVNFEPAKPFTIGLKPLSPENLLQMDDDCRPYRKEKLALYAKQFDRVCMAEPDTLNAQIEVENLIHNNLTRHHNDRYAIEDNQATCADTGECFMRDPDMPIASTALLVPEDLLLMRRGETGWRLVAASLSFPSSWNLQEKFSKPLEAIHGPVPIPEKMSLRINRIFDGLQPDIPVWRSNWSLDDNGLLRHDRSETHRDNKHERLTGKVYLRTEHQTVHKLPHSQDILFTVRIKTRPITGVLNSPNGRKSIATLHQQYCAMSDVERDYKGINHHAGRFLNWLEENGTHEHV